MSPARVKMTRVLRVGELYHRRNRLANARELHRNIDGNHGLVAPIMTGKSTGLARTRPENVGLIINTSHKMQVPYSTPTPSDRLSIPPVPLTKVAKSAIIAQTISGETPFLSVHNIYKLPLLRVGAKTHVGKVHSENQDPP